MDVGKNKRRVVCILRILEKLFPDMEGTELNYSNNWELLVAVILSAQCTDKKVNEVTKGLFRKYHTLKDYVNADPREFEKDIYSTGFYRMKAKNILAAAKIVNEKFHGKIPRRMEELLTIPGVARKTADVVLGNAYGIIVGVVVDTHVIRLSRLLGLTSNRDPKKIERDLMEVVHQKDWFRFSNYLVLYGRRYCPAKKHGHQTCPLTNI